MRRMRPGNAARKLPACRNRRLLSQPLPPPPLLQEGGREVYQVAYTSYREKKQKQKTQTRTRRLRHGHENRKGRCCSRTKVKKAAPVGSDPATVRSPFRGNLCPRSVLLHARAPWREIKKRQTEHTMCQTVRRHRRLYNPLR